MGSKEIIPPARAPRKRKPYQRSRKGCGNCKLRSVKCDETKPQCLKCNVYGVVCNYASTIADLQAPTQGVETWKLSNQTNGYKRLSKMPLEPLLQIAINCGTGASSFTLNDRCVDLMEQFRVTTLRSLGGPKFVDLGERLLAKYAVQYPFFAHTILAATALHERYLKSPRATTQTPSEFFHQNQSIKLFNEALSRPIEQDARDPLWATAGFLGIVTFSSFDATSPEEAWPLKPNDPSDLDWLRMSSGKMAVWNLTDPLRPDSMFLEAAQEYAQVFSPIPDRGIVGVDPQLAEICELDATSTISNPYFAVVHVLARQRSLEYDMSTKGRWLNFLHHMSQPFRAKLFEKDPRAMLLLALWYKRARKALWWIDRRATIETEAICIYLEKFCRDDIRIQSLMSRELKSERSVDPCQCSDEL